MKSFFVLFASAAVLLLMGCSSVSVTTDYDHEANFAVYKTFDWMTVSQDVVSANVQSTMFQNSLLDKRVKSSVNTQLTAKGLTQSATNPDLYLMYHTGTQQKVSVTDYGYGYGRWGGGTDVHQYTQGTMIVDIVDAKTKQLVWRGAASGALADQPDPATAAEKIDGIVQQMFQNYPPKPGK